jgi:RNA polymerase sigma-70 factor (ECF subfamily)
VIQGAVLQLRLVRRGSAPPFEAAVMVVDPLGDLARAARDGDLRAQRRLFEAVAPALLQSLRMILGPGHPDLEDVLQESLLGLLHGLATFRWESTVLHFARRVAAKRAIEFCRRQQTTARKLEHVRELVLPEPATPREVVVADRRREHLRALLRELPATQAETLAMRAVLGYSLEEIAEATEVPLNTVRSRLRLAKEALRRRIDSDPLLVELLGKTS